jgi:hypothetical protein
MKTCNLRLFPALVPVLALRLLAAADVVPDDVERLFQRGDWDRALLKLQLVPDRHGDPAIRELLAMAYLYTSSRLDSAENAMKAKELASQLVNEGKRARFYVSKARNIKPNQIHLVEATPGELIITKAGVEFMPQKGLTTAPQTWKSQEISECEPNTAFGQETGSFHLTAGGNSVHFRPLHFSATEAELICQLVPKVAASAPAVSKPAEGKKDEGKGKGKNK